MRNSQSSTLLISILIGQQVDDNWGERIETHVNIDTRVCQGGLYSLMRAPLALFCQIFWLMKALQDPRESDSVFVSLTPTAINAA